MPPTTATRNQLFSTTPHFLYHPEGDRFSNSFIINSNTCIAMYQTDQLEAHIIKIIAPLHRELPALWAWEQWYLLTPADPTHRLQLY